MKICLVTSSQPSANPRLVKEADALSEAGYQVHVVAAHRVDWATASDQTLLAGRNWDYTFIDWRRETQPGLFWKTRARHYVARAAQASPLGRPFLIEAAVDRITPELKQATAAVRSDLYVAHNPGALPAAAHAAHTHGALLGFDAEDYHSGEFAETDRSSARTLIERLERKFIPQCDYVTAGSNRIGDAYAPLCRSRRPTTILNVFPLAMRPPSFTARGPAGPLTLYWFSQTIGPDRGLEDVVRAMGRLPRGAVQLHLRGRWHSGYDHELHQVAAAAGVDADAIHSHAPANPADMVRLAATYDVGLALETVRTPNRRIALTNKIFTYLLAGIGTLATRTPAQGDLAGEFAGAAQFYAPGDVDGAARILKDWLAEPERLETARRRAWQLGETRYNWDVEKHTYLRVIADVFALAVRPAPRTVKAYIGEQRA
jgi:glycosyltransferase involved in cell wall biosynthesis